MNLQQQTQDYGNFAVIANSGLLLTYSIPNFIPTLAKGTLCILPLKSGKNSKKVVGVFLEYCSKPTFNCVDVLSLFPFPVFFSKEHFSLFEWVSEYYVTTIAKTLHLLAPGFVWNCNKHSIIEKELRFSNKKNIKKLKEKWSFKTTQ
ncbi:MAG: hypothetical protein V4591_12255 [Bdellovibrionota bacterium]